MGAIESWISILGLPLASGVNLYATILVLGLGRRFGWLEGLPEQFDVLSHPVVLGAAGVLYVVEFFADKIPFLDTLWDALHTLIRPLGAALLALNAAADLGPWTQFAALLAGAALGLSAHSTKAGARMLVNTSPEPASNSVVSVAEDFGVVGLLAVMYTYPWVALGIVLGLIAVMAFAAPFLFRMIRFLLNGAGGVLASWFGSAKEPLRSAPDWLARQTANAAHPAQPGIFRCFARDVPGAPRCQPGYLLIFPGGSQFAFKTAFRKGVIPLSEGSTPHPELVRRILFDVLLFDGGKFAICVAKDWSPAVQAALGLARGEERFAGVGSPAPRGSR